MYIQVILGNILLYYIDAKCHFYVVGMYLVHDMQEYSSCWATVFETEIEFSQHTTTILPSCKSPKSKEFKQGAKLKDQKEVASIYPIVF